MDFHSQRRTVELHRTLSAFVTEGRPSPGERGVPRAAVDASGDPHFHPPVMEELKAEARARGLWNLFLPEAGHGPEDGGPGLSNAE